jgi:hypothetical protein
VTVFQGQIRILSSGSATLVPTVTKRFLNSKMKLNVVKKMTIIIYKERLAIGKIYSSLSNRKTLPAASALSTPAQIKRITKR